MFLTFFMGFGAGGFQLALLRIAGEFNISSGMVGALVAAQFSAAVVFPVAFGWLSDAIGKKKVLMIWCAVMVVDCVFIAAFPRVAVFAAGMFFWGAGGSMCESTCGAAINDAYEKNRERYMNYVQAFFCLGAAVGPFITDFLFGSGFDWRIVFIIGGSAYGLGFVFLIFIKIGKPDALRISGASGVKINKPPYGLLLRPVFICLIISITLYVAVETAVSFFLDYLFTEGLSAPQFSAAAISLFWISMMVSRLISALAGKSEKKLTQLSFLLTALFAAIITFVKNPALALVCCFMLGFSHGPVWPNIVAFAAREHPDNTGLTSGSMTGGSGFGGALSPVLMGVIADRAGIRASFLVFAAVSLVGFLSVTGYIRLKNKAVLNSVCL